MLHKRSRREKKCERGVMAFVEAFLWRAGTIRLNAHRCPGAPGASALCGARHTLYRFFCCARRYEVADNWVLIVVAEELETHTKCLGREQRFGSTRFSPVTCSFCAWGGKLGRGDARSRAKKSSRMVRGSLIFLERAYVHFDV